MKLRLEADTARKLKVVCDRNGVSRSQLLSEAIEALYEEGEGVLMPIISKNPDAKFPDSDPSWVDCAGRCMPIFHVSEFLRQKLFPAGIRRAKKTKN